MKTKERFILAEVPFMTRLLPGSNIAEVFLNNELQKFCLYANTEEGCIERARLNENGKPKIYDNGTSMATGIVYGDVKIRIPFKSLLDFGLFIEEYFSHWIHR